MATTLQEFDRRMWKTLTEDDTQRYISADILQNGLQSFGSEEVRRVGFGVSASLELFKIGAQADCDVIVTHHGLMLPAKQLDQITYNRLAYLIQNEISLWSAHYTLDAHSILGNNVQIIEEIGAIKRERYSHAIGDAPWGWSGAFSSPTTIEAILDSVKDRFSPAIDLYAFGPREIQKIVVLSGHGAPSQEELWRLKQANIDLIITGEVNEWNREPVREAGMNLIAGGHYHTETFGVQALQKEVSTWGVDTIWLDLPNPR